MAKKIVRSDERKSIMGLEVNGPVFFTSSIFIIISIALTLIFKDESEDVFDSIHNLRGKQCGLVLRIVCKRISHFRGLPGL